MSKRGATADSLEGEQDASRIKVVLMKQGDQDEVEFVDQGNGLAIDAVVLLAVFPAEIVLTILFGSPEPHRVLRAFEKHGPVARDYVIANRLWAILFSKNYPLQWKLSHNLSSDIRATYGGDMNWKFRGSLDSISDTPRGENTYWKRYYELMEMPHPCAVTNARARSGGYHLRDHRFLVPLYYQDTILYATEINLDTFDNRIITNAEGRRWWRNSGATLYTSSQAHLGAHVFYMFAASFRQLGNINEPENVIQGPHTPHPTHMLKIDFAVELSQEPNKPLRPELTVIPYDETELGVPLRPNHATGGWDIRSPDGFSWAVITMRFYMSNDIQIINQSMAKRRGSIPQGPQLVSSELIECDSCEQKREHAYRCKRCKKAHYCSSACQRDHWHSHHRYKCCRE